MHSTITKERTERLEQFSISLGNCSISNIIGVPTVGNVTKCIPEPSTARAIATERLKAESCGVPSASNGTGRSNSIPKRTKSMIQHLYRDDSSPLGGASCSVPSMDFLSNEDNETGSKDIATGLNLFPGLGTHLELDPICSSASSLLPGRQNDSASVIPEMSATVLDANIDAPRPSGSSSPNSDDPTDQSSSTASDSKTTENIDAANIARPIIWTRSSVSQAPSVLAQSLAKSFSSLVDSRVRAWTLFLLRHSLSNGEQTSRSILLKFLATKSAFDLSAIVTTFKTLELPQEAKDQLEKEAEERKLKIKNNQKERKLSTDDCDLVLPLNFQCIIDVKLAETQLTIKIHAPGTIAAMYHEDTSLMTFIECKLDTVKLIRSMMQQARIVVFEAVARATSFKTPSTNTQKLTPPKGGVPSTISHIGSLKNLSSLSRSDEPTASIHQVSQSKMKAAASARAFSNLISNKSNNTDNTSTNNATRVLRNSYSQLGRKNKNRSVTWNKPIEEGSSSERTGKRRRLGISPSLKRSIKSFGKPDANDFQCVRNATFNEFGSLNRSGGKLSITSSQIPNASNVKMDRMKSCNNVNASFGPRNIATPSARSMDNRAFLRQFAVQPAKSNRERSHLSSNVISDTTSSANNLKHTPTLLELMLLSAQKKQS